MAKKTTMAKASYYFFGAALSIVLGWSAFSSATPATFGWLESIYLQPSGKKLISKLDTGARTSSIHATNIVPFERDGARWVSFTVSGKKPKGRRIFFERPIARETLVKEHAGASQPRYVVELDFCLAGRVYRKEFSLANRENFNYRVILGRTALQGSMVVDPGQKFTADKSCKSLHVKNKK
jgi:hypothetical protein